ncbi:Hypothetical predicted protein [Pelobates cultripes]|uniref:Uncharacterized protein n=1 Tax=Pelobates cultripes TaxID=61616 RepID=A0AAD1SW16_PELCU|nr:Hypothetical predicted protein [Pelobates cultripes]
MTQRKDGSTYSSDDFTADVAEGASCSSVPGVKSVPPEDRKPITAAILKAMLRELGANITADISQFKDAFACATMGITLLEATTSTQETRLATVEQKLGKLQRKQQDMEARVESLKDQKRRYNLKVRGIPEAGTDEMLHYIRRLFAVMISPKHAKLTKMDGMFWLPKPLNAPSTATADLINCFKTTHNRLLFLMAVKGKTPIPFEG